MDRHCSAPVVVAFWVASIAAFAAMGAAAMSLLLNRFFGGNQP